MQRVKATMAVHKDIFATNFQIWHIRKLFLRLTVYFWSHCFRLLPRSHVTGHLFLKPHCCGDDDNDEHSVKKRKPFIIP